MSAVGELDRLLSDSHDRLVESAVARVAGAGGEAVPVSPAGVDACVREVAAALPQWAACCPAPDATARVATTALEQSGAALPGSVRVLKALRLTYLDLIADELAGDDRVATATAVHEFFDAAELALIEHGTAGPATDTPGSVTASAAGPVDGRVFDVALSTAPHQLYAFDADLQCIFARIGSSSDCPFEPGAAGRHLLEFDLPRSFTTQLAADARRALESGLPRRGEVVLLQCEQTVHCAYTLQRAPSTADEPDLVCLTLCDVSELRVAQQAQRAATDRLRAVYASAPMAAVSVDLEGRVTSWSPGAERMFGWTEAEVLGRRYPTVADDDWGEYKHSLLETVSGHPLQAVDTRRRHRDGSWVDVSLSAAPLHGPDGQAIGVVSILVDTTARRQVERSLALSEERFARVIEVVPAVFATLTPDGSRLLELSAGYENFLGYPPGPLLERVDVWRSIVHPDDVGRLERALGAGLTHERGGEFRVIAADGSTKWVRVHACPVRDADGAVETVSVFAMDITDYKASEGALTRSRDTAWALLNATSDMAMLVDTQWRILGVNEAFARALGTPIGELLGSDAFEHFDPETAASRRARAEEAIRTGLPVRFEDEAGGMHHLNCFYPVCESSGRVVTLAIFCQDISDQRRAEDAQRLAAVGQLAAGVAHEFNNLLASMMMRAGLAAASGATDDYQKLAEIVLQMCERGSELTSSLIGLTQPRPPRKAAVQIVDALEAALAAAAQEIKGAGIEVKRHYDADAGLVLADSGQMEQVFLNLIINACHAMPGGGVLSISTNGLRRDCGPGKVIVTVSDTGEGIAPEHLSRIFEPFFTTKGLLGRGDVPGTGLGLSVSHGIVSSHSGTIEAESRLGVGTAFRITLDAIDPAIVVGSEQVRPGAAGRSTGTHTVLFADDEPELCEIIEEALSLKGYAVTAVATTDEALETLVGGSFDLVITDLLMPGAGGKAVVAAANALDPRPTVLVVTGRVGGGLAQELIACGADGCLQKPFTVPELIATIEQLTGDRHITTA